METAKAKITKIDKIFFGLSIFLGPIGSLFLGPNIVYILLPTTIYFSFRFIYLLLKSIGLAKLEGFYFAKLSILTILFATTVIGSSRLQMNHGQGVFKSTVKLIEKYKQDKGEYPIHLSSLVPEYLKEVPNPYFGFVENAFYYKHFPDDEDFKHPTFFLIVLAPFGRQVYSFQRKEFNYLD